MCVTPETSPTCSQKSLHKIVRQSVWMWWYSVVLFPRIPTSKTVVLYFQQYFYPHRYEYELCSLVWLNLKVIHDALNCNHREIPFDVRTQSLRFTDFIWDVHPLKGAVKLVVLKDKRRWFLCASGQRPISGAKFYILLNFAPQSDLI